MSILNPTFSEGGAAQGVPAHWTLTSLVRAQRVAGFGPAPERGVEHFERWHALSTGLDLTVRAFFDLRPEGFEDFTEAFGTDTYTLRFEDARFEHAAFDTEPRETFGRGFGNDSFPVRWGDLTAVSALFGGNPSERFERGFRNNVFAWVISDVLISPARFGGRIAETFEITWPEHDAR